MVGRITKWKQKGGQETFLGMMNQAQTWEKP